MPRGFLKEVAEVSYPEEHLEDLKRAEPLILAALKRDGLPIESGLINMRKIDNKLDIAMFFLRWIGQVNGIIENLNAILTDMRDLPTNYIFLRGSPKTRFYLLVRTYFYEFYRFRETYNQVVKAAAERGYMERNEVAGVRQVFHDAFAQAIELRNNLVHGTPIWQGQRHFDLTLLAMAQDSGFALHHRETGEIWNFGAVLKDICPHTADILRDEGNRMSKVIQALVRVYVDLAAKV
jgi:hypothetical protein